MAETLSASALKAKEQNMNYEVGGALISDLMRSASAGAAAKAGLGRSGALRFSCRKMKMG